MVISIFIALVVGVIGLYLLFLKPKPAIANESKNYRVIQLLFILKRLLILTGVIWLSAISSWLIITGSAFSIAQGSKMIILVDVSKSMLTVDIVSGGTKISRLDVAKSKAIEMIRTFAWHPISIIAFAWESRTITPFTTDSESNINAVTTLLPESVSVGWSEIVTTLVDALAIFEPSEAGSVILMSDGDDRSIDTSPLESLIRTHQKVHIYPIGIGGDTPSPLVLGKDIIGNLRYKQVDWKILQTKLEDDNLKTLASMTDGKYFHYLDTASLSSDQASSPEKSYSWLAIALNLMAILIMLGLILPYRYRWKK